MVSEQRGQQWLRALRRSWHPSWNRQRLVCRCGSAEIVGGASARSATGSESPKHQGEPRARPAGHRTKFPAIRTVRLWVA